MIQSIKELQLRISKFCDDRDWNQFHSPKSLAMSISIEAAELLENFQWSKDDEPLSTTNKESISEEIADVLIYAIRLCEVLEVDPIEISNKKIDKNAIKYPVIIRPLYSTRLSRASTHRVHLSFHLLPLSPSRYIYLFHFYL